MTRTPSDPTHPSLTADFASRRAALLADRAIVGADLVVPYTALVDEWLAQSFDAAFGSAGGDIALVATGGHGRAELTPKSDLDLLLVHGGEIDDARAGALWYPLWDSGLKIGHGVRTLDETLSLARADLEVATSILSVRHLAGSRDVAEELASRSAEQWSSAIDRWRSRLGESVRLRHGNAAEVAFALEPDLKDGRGGLRDVHAIGWATAAGAAMGIDDRPDLSEAYRTLLDVRVELHRCETGAGNVLLLQEQDAVAEALGTADADALMAGVASAGRQIAFASDEFWFDLPTTARASRRFGALRRRRPNGGPPPQPQGLLVESDGRLGLGPDADLTDPLLVIRVALAAATGGLRIHRDALAAAVAAPPIPEPWSNEARDLFVELLATGSIETIEAIDQAGLWVRLIPEWEPNRNRPQRNAYHRFTVDRHLLETVRNAAARADTVSRPDLLVMGALLHDIGKGYPGDHTVVGMDLARNIATRMGFERVDVETIVAMVKHHLLLPDVATRRDLDDPETVTSVAASIGSIQRLELLGALTEADSLATGPAAWSGWKEHLVRDLVIRTAHVVRGGALGDVITPSEPSVEASELLEQVVGTDDPLFRQIDDRLVIACRDRPGLFSRIAGVLALNGLEVLEASVHSEHGYALDEFRFVSRFASSVPLSAIRRDLERALTGRLALPARLAEKARSYPNRSVSAHSMNPDVIVLNDVSRDASVIEVIGPDSLGLLYRLTLALTDLRLDISSAKVTTIGADAVDAFYVTDADGRKVGDDQIPEIYAALLHAIHA